MKIRKSRAPVSYAARREEITLVGGGVNRCAYSRNYTAGKDGLRIGYNIHTPSGYSFCPSDVTAAYHSDCDDYVYLIAESGIYAGKDSPESERQLVSVCSGQITEPFFVESLYGSKMAAVVFGGAYRYVCKSGVVTTIQTDSEYVTGAFHAGRVFAVKSGEPLVIYWSAQGAFKWGQGIHDGGNLTLTGKGGGIVRLISLGDKLLIMRRFGITVVRAYGDAQFFKAEPTHTYLVADGIIGATCAVCGGKVYFCTSSGAYYYDGDSVKRAELPNGEIPLSPKSGASFGGTYFISCADGERDNAVYAYDTVEGTGCYLDAAADAFWTGYSVYAVGEGKIVRIEKSEKGTGIWRSETLYFDKPRFVKEVVAEGDAAVSATVYTDYGSSSFTGGKILLNCAVKSLSVEIEGDCALKSVRVVTEVADGI